MNTAIAKQYKELSVRISKINGINIPHGNLMEKALIDYYNKKTEELNYMKWKRSVYDAVYERDGGICLWCHSFISKKRATLDHLIPIGRGGSPIDVSNVTICCKPCNQNKANLTPEEYLIKLGFK
jgi:5-methylcytosine-specific restriction endonuclease McrA